MDYATYSDFNARYATRLDPAEVASHYLPYAAARLEALLAPGFTAPFSTNNLTARDLTLDLAYLLMLQRHREQGDREGLERMVLRRIRALNEGQEAMQTTSGESLFARAASGVVWGSTAPYRTVFGRKGAGDPEGGREEE
ncbi:MAG: hypothetical protein OEW39_06295 [Deltaproteobacteria bacterium]|nr:hypothetical protein [Deltaproteobacteria bacterium]